MIVRVYEGTSEDAAVRHAKRETKRMGQRGYVITRARWSPAQVPPTKRSRAVRRILIALALAAFATTLALWWVWPDATSDRLPVLLAVGVLAVIDLALGGRASLGRPVGMLVVTWTQTIDGMAQG